jgi:hypothetical protein
VLAAELGFDAAEERRVAQQRIEMRRHDGYGDGVALIGDGAVQVGQRFRVTEGRHLRQDAL